MINARNSRLHHEIAAYDSWLRLTEQEKTARRIIVECIESVVKENIASDAKVQLFGSSATELCLPTSYVLPYFHPVRGSLGFRDIDIVVTTPQRWGEVFQTRVLAQLSCLVRDVRLAWRATEYPHPQVPILKFIAMQEFGKISLLLCLRRSCERQELSMLILASPTGRAFQGT